jgi:glycosyltransferase involved in cell wall biosynthesis
LILATHRLTGSRVLVQLAFEETESNRNHGGRRRGVQLEEILTAQGFDLAPLPEDQPPHRLATLFWGLRAYLELGWFSPLCLDSLRCAGASYRRFQRAARRHHPVESFLLEGTGDAALMMVQAAKRAGIKAIVIPANVESLATYTDVFTHRIGIMRRLAQDMKYLRMADAVFCISMEEEWLLRILGANAFFLPYWPASALKSKLEKIRLNRAAVSPRDFLLLGSVLNQPTRRGFETLYRHLQACPRLAVKIHVAGFGTETLRDQFTDERFILHGAVTDEELDDLLTRCRALLLLQPPSSGMLTRVLEAWYAGIPIIGNGPALKGYRLVPGMYCFETAPELAALLVRDLPRVTPPPPEIDENLGPAIARLGELLKTG